MRSPVAGLLIGRVPPSAGSTALLSMKSLRMGSLGDSVRASVGGVVVIARADSRHRPPVPQQKPRSLLIQIDDLLERAGVMRWHHQELRFHLVQMVQPPQRLGELRWIVVGEVTEGRGLVTGQLDAIHRPGRVPDEEDPVSAY